MPTTPRMLIFNSAPDKTKNKMKMGGVMKYKSPLISSAFELTLPNTAPNIMAVSKGDACNHSAKKIDKKMIATDKLMRFPRPVNHLQPKVKIIPITEPMASDTIISINGFNICNHRG